MEKSDFGSSFSKNIDVQNIINTQFYTFWYDFHIN